MVLLDIKFSWTLLIFFITLTNVLITILQHITKLTPTPYIDEIFHIPQAQRYCDYKFNEWDDKITTLPGLYLISISIIKPLESALKLNLCSVYGLRFVNVIGTLINFILCYCIQQKLKTKQGNQEVIPILSATNAVLFPPLFFFTFLYYTDVWSTVFVLLMYFLHISKSPYLASLAGVCAVLMRQTNILWVGMLTLDSGWTAIAGKKSNVSSIMEMEMLIVKSINFKNILRVLQAVLPYLTICCFFLAFVIINEGIVVGDRTAHTVVLHPMQNFYLLDIAVFFALPYIVFEIPDLLMNRPRLSKFCLIWLLVAVLSEINFVEHPYLLADNRHLSFYIWKRLFGHRIFRRILTLSYVLSGYLLLRLLRRKLSFEFTVCLGLCTVLNLTPQYLFEIRYFIIPFLLARLHFPQNAKAVILETVFFLIINAAVFYIYFKKEFTWSSEPGAKQRIIWLLARRTVYNFKRTLIRSFRTCSTLLRHFYWVIRRRFFLQLKKLQNL